MVRIISVEAELEKVARGRKTKLGIENLAALVLEMGIAQERRELRKRKREDVRFLETLYRLKDERA